MKRNNFFSLPIVLAVCCIVFLLESCSKNNNAVSKQTQTYTIYTDLVYKAKADILASINDNPSQSIDHAGKIYIKGNYIYLNEVNRGIHIIDNNNAAHPVQIAFLAIPGNLDIAIKGNTLYADMYTDLLALDISNPLQAKLTGQVNNFFVGRAYSSGPVATLSDSILVDWKEKDTTVFVDQYPYYEAGRVVMFQNAGGGPRKSSGTAGSMAGMVMINDYLYAITEMHSMGIVDISNPAVPKLDSSFFAGYDLQTIFPFEDKLFLGSAIGMFIYDVSDPRHPAKMGEFTHGRACDPVISDGNYAYVTLHGGDDCGGDQNELDIIDIKDLLNSTLVKTYPLTKPTGLCKDGDLLFICDGTSVKIYNAANPSGLQLLQQIPAKDPYDIIASNNKAIVVTSEGLYQYNYSNMKFIRQLSFLAAKQ